MQAHNDCRPNEITDSQLQYECCLEVQDQEQ